MKQKRFANIALVVLIIVLVSVASYFVLAKKSESTTQPHTISQNEIANWKTYRNDKFSFSFKYPASLVTVSSGPNDEQKKLERGETISGTVPPFYDTITFSDQTNKEQFNVVIFPVRSDEISLAGFKGHSDNGVIKSGDLSRGSACDTRWVDSISEEPTLVKKNGISVLEVQVIAGGPKEGVSNGCYYLKNAAGNLIVFNISGIAQKAEFLNIFRLVGDKILPTLNLLK